LTKGTNKEEIAQSPFVEQLLRKGYEVIYFTDVLDEYVMQVCWQATLSGRTAPYRPPVVAVAYYWHCDRYTQPTLLILFCTTHTAHARL
jgi:hypothetical protein